MTVNGVNNSNNNAKTNAIAYAATGGGAAGIAAYYTKNIAKNGKFTDEFINQTYKNLLKDSKPFESLQTGLNSLISKSKNKKVKVDELFDEAVKLFNKSDYFNLTKSNLKLARNKDTIKKVFKNKKELVKFLRSEVWDNTRIVGGMINGKKDPKLCKKLINDDLTKIYDFSKNALKEGAEKTCSIVKQAKSAITDIKLKQAGIYGGITALVLGIGTYLLCRKKSANKEQKV